jgi:hypothetical protein
MVFANIFSDACSAFALIAIFFGVVGGIKWFIEWKIDDAKAREEAEKAAAEKEWQRQNPELWRAQEMVRLEKERLETQTRLAEEKAKHERTGDQLGGVLAAGRFFGWW